MENYDKIFSSIKNAFPRLLLRRGKLNLTGPLMTQVSRALTKKHYAEWTALPPQTGLFIRFLEIMDSYRVTLILHITIWKKLLMLWIKLEICGNSNYNWLLFWLVRGVFSIWICNRGCYVKQNIHNVRLFVYFLSGDDIWIVVLLYIKNKHYCFHATAVLEQNSSPQFTKYWIVIGLSVLFVSFFIYVNNM